MKQTFFNKIAKNETFFENIYQSLYESHKILSCEPSYRIAVLYIQMQQIQLNIKQVH
jgi:hypothetical protein